MLFFFPCIACCPVDRKTSVVVVQAGGPPGAVAVQPGAVPQLGGVVRGGLCEAGWAGMGRCGAVLARKSVATCEVFPAGWACALCPEPCG